MKKIRIAIGKTPISKLFLANETSPLNLLHQPVIPIHHAFRPMVEKMAFDVSELAIVTAIQAVEQNRNIVPLPITVWARLQHKCIIQNGEFTNFTPADLEGKRIAVRSFSQTTGAWVRTILDIEYGVDCTKIEWITQEAPHVAGAPEPSIVVRDPNGASPLDLIRQGAVDAAIFGNDLPDEHWAKPIIADPDNAGRASLDKTGIIQINHIIAVSRPFFEQRQSDVKMIMRGFSAARHQLSKNEQRMLPAGRGEMRKSVEKLIGSLLRQGLITRSYRFDDIFGDGMGLYETLPL
ncbi:MAG: hypothetical protein ACJ0BO_01420 [Candidatus Puniceispirillaceae bacterium]